MKLEFDSPTLKTAGFPENYLPTALPLLLGEAPAGLFYPLIPVPLPKMDAGNQIKSIRAETLGQPQALVDFLNTQGDAETRFIGPAVKGFNEQRVDPVPLTTSDGSGNVDVTVVIDAGIAFWNSRFAFEDGKNRFVDIGFLSFNSQKKTAPVVQFIGTDKIHKLTGQITRQGHDRGIQKELGEAFPESVYGIHSEAGQLFNPDGFNHGTAIADIAAGDNPNDLPTGKTAAVLFGVELPSTVLLDANGESLQAVVSLAIREAIARVYKWASEAGNSLTPHIKFVLPFAFLGGPHDGKHPVVKNINQYVNMDDTNGPTVQFFVPNGNHQQDQLHAGFDILCEGDLTKPLSWFLQPDDYSSNTVEITYQGSPCQSLQITTPDGRSATATLGDGHLSLLTLGGQKIGAVWTRAINDGQTRIRLSLGATASSKPSGQRLPTGNWALQLGAKNGLMENIQMWILREDGTGFTKRPHPARQSYFNDQAYLRNATSGGYLKTDTEGSTIRRLGSVSVLATSDANGVINVEAQEKLGGNAEIAWYSGHPKEGVNANVKILVDDGRVSRGIAALVNGSARKQRISGTSIAVAIAARES